MHFELWAHHLGLQKKHTETFYKNSNPEVKIVLRNSRKLQNILIEETWRHSWATNCSLKRRLYNDFGATCWPLHMLEKTVGNMIACVRVPFGAPSLQAVNGKAANQPICWQASAKPKQCCRTQIRDSLLTREELLSTLIKLQMLFRGKSLYWTPTYSIEGWILMRTIL